MHSLRILPDAIAPQRDLCSCGALPCEVQLAWDGDHATSAQCAACLLETYRGLAARTRMVAIRTGAWLAVHTAETAAKTWASHARPVVEGLVGFLRGAA